MNATHVRQMYESLGPVGYAHKVYQLIGLENERTGQRVLVEDRPALAPNRHLRPEQFSLRRLAESLLGHDVERALKTPTQHVNLFEAGGTEVGPSFAANISAFNTTVAGLIEAKVLEAYSRPEYIADQLTERIPSNKRSERFIGVALEEGTAETRKPGNRHARIGLTEKYVDTPATVNRALAIDVTREAVLFDQTKDILNQAEGVGDEVAMRKELAVIDMVLGVTNTYKVNGTTYNTYLTSGGWINVIASNPLVDWTDVDEAIALFSEMVDEQGRAITVLPKNILVMPQKVNTAKHLLQATAVESRTQSAAVVAVGSNPIAGQFNVLTSVHAYARAKAATGLNLNATNASGLWYVGDFQKAFAYVENLPLTVERANPTDYEMRDRGLVLSVFADEMGTPATKNPRYVVKCKNEA